MVKSKFSRLAILGLATLSNQAIAQVSLSGQLRLDAKFVSVPGNMPDTLEISRARVEALGDISSDWTARLRFDKSDIDNNIVLSRAYASWSASDNAVVHIGKAGHISADVDDKYYAPHITAHGLLEGFHSDDIGLSVEGIRDTFNYSVGLVNSDYTADVGETGLGWSYTAHGRLTAIESDSMSWGLGLGYVHRLHQDLNIDSDDGTNNDSATFDKYSGWTLDLSGTTGKLALTGALYLRTDWASTTDLTAYNPYILDGNSNSFYLEGMYLVTGNGYGFSGGVLSSPQFESSALEVGMRYSQTVRKNAAAIIHQRFYRPDTYFAPTSIDTFAEGDQLKAKIKAISLLANYYFSKNTILLGEYYSSKETTVNNMVAEGEQIEEYKNHHLKLRFQVDF